ncbi:integrase arm-type DNA-binding domain-containing protein [Parahaliea sp. F7430]|uniref:Integrase arm-type DNA-binding domain-containing protein n=1 Tax=Sediminihaliea albiluteola TaxID=2758564 RepID=A0A7W2TY72_9GAMM|nr:integrase arm-type DNA-binding domain-containing protein [Sediminihaliea albiluteola]MBA6413969.1 integrase arm-type DNA-binding domain-containing protein [Sediminihaliea albiluteola]
MHKLTATAIKNAKPESKPRKLADGGGLYLLIDPKGRKYWRYDYRYVSKRKTLALGVYPEVTLKEAREAHYEARRQLAKGIDPGEVRKVEKQTRLLAAADSFEAIGREWFNQIMDGKSESYRVRTGRILEKDLYPYLGNRPIASITPPEILGVLRRIERRGAVDIAHRAKQTAGLIFRYAVATGRAERDPTGDLKGALKPKNKKHHAAITEPAEVGRLLVAIDDFQGTAVVSAALRLSCLLFQRPGEIRSMEWAEVNWEAQRWELPAEKMKMRLPHIVPLSRQALDILGELHRLTGRGRYVFPSARGASRAMSDNAVRTALRTMGYTNDQMTAHGFRAMARTLLDEALGFKVDWIEHQLAHAVKDPNGRAYNRTSHLEGRVEMMQSWADYLDELHLNAEATSGTGSNHEKLAAT